MAELAGEPEAILARIGRLIEEEAGGKYSRFARRAGIATSTVQGWLKKGSATPTATQARKISDTFDVRVEWLITGQLPMREDITQPHQAAPEASDETISVKGVPKCVRRVLKAQAAFFEGMSEETAAPICDNIMGQLRTRPDKKAGD